MNVENIEKSGTGNMRSGDGDVMKNPGAPMIAKNGGTAAGIGVTASGVGAVTVIVIEEDAPEAVTAKGIETDPHVEDLGVGSGGGGVGAAIAGRGAEKGDGSGAGSERAAKGVVPLRRQGKTEASRLLQRQPPTAEETRISQNSRCFSTKAVVVYDC